MRSRYGHFRKIFKLHCRTDLCNLSISSPTVIGPILVDGTSVACPKHGTGVDLFDELVDTDVMD